jgi:hypothetical protein
MQAIRTRYHGPTNTRGSRISATCQAGRITVAYDHGLSESGNHRAAAMALREKLNWTSETMLPMYYGTHDGDVFHVFANPAERTDS